jgi:AcrR family transcriptional regulator
MFTEMKTRRYRLGKRARQQEQTRQRIVEAAVALHEELGPRDTTISAIAERAGVQRLTVYRHFHDDAELFAACSGHWLELNPPPDPAQWSGHDDPGRRSIVALSAVYAYFRRTRGMLEGVYRDRAEMPAVDAVMAGFDAYLDAVRRDLAACWNATRPARSRSRDATIVHCLRFSTWTSLAEQGLSDRRMAQLAVRWIEAAGNDEAHARYA